MDSETRHRPARPARIYYPEIPAQSDISDRHLFVAAGAWPAIVNLWDEARLPAPGNSDEAITRIIANDP